MPSPEVIHLIGHTQTFKQIVLSGDEAKAQTFAIETLGPALDALLAPGGIETEEDSVIVLQVLGATLQILLSIAPRPARDHVITKMLKIAVPKKVA